MDVEVTAFLRYILLKNIIPRKLSNLHSFLTSCCISLTSGYFTAPVEGLYLFMATVTSAFTGKYERHYLYKEGNYT